MDVSNALQTMASVLAIIYTADQIYQRVRRIPVEIANKWLTAIYECQQILNSVRTSGGNLGTAWKIGERVTSENELTMKIDEIRNTTRSRRVRDTCLALQESLRKIWASAQPLVPIVYFLDELDEIQSSSKGDMSTKFQDLQLSAAVDAEIHIAKLVEFIQKRRAKV